MIRERLFREAKHHHWMDGMNPPATPGEHREALLRVVVLPQSLSADKKTTLTVSELLSKCTSLLLLLFYLFVRVRGTPGCVTHVVAAQAAVELPALVCGLLSETGWLRSCRLAAANANINAQTLGGFCP